MQHCCTSTIVFRVSLVAAADISLLPRKGSNIQPLPNPIQSNDNARNYAVFLIAPKSPSSIGLECGGTKWRWEIRKRKKGKREYEK